MAKSLDGSELLAYFHRVHFPKETQELLTRNQTEWSKIEMKRRKRLSDLSQIRSLPDILLFRTDAFTLVAFF